MAIQGVMLVIMSIVIKRTIALDLPRVDLLKSRVLARRAIKIF
jgi:hypothetical protein